MASRRLVPASVREALLGIPSDIASLERNYLLADDDLDLIGTRRRPENRLGLALHIALLRHPGQGWLDDTDPPTPLVAWLAEQIKVPFPALARYGSRGATRSNHRRLAIRHLGLRAFVPAHDMRTAMDVAARAAFDTDDGRIILARVSGAIQAQRFVLPSADTLERIGLAGRARARRLSAQAVNDALDDERKQALNALLAYDPSLGRSRLTWLRTSPQSTSAPSMLALLERLTYVRAIALPRHLGDNIHPARRAQFAREGAVAPVNLLSDFGSRRRIASLAALMLELETTLTDAAIALFERLTGRLFTRSRNSQDRSWSASKTQAGRLIRLFGGAIDAMVRAREDDRDPFDVLDEEIGWDRLVASREEIAALGDLATQDPLSLATQRYAQLRRFAPAFLDAFEFDAPAAGHDLQAAVTLLRELNRTGKRTLPDIVPMPFPSQHWRAVILHNATPQRRIYETAVVATLRDRLRAGDIWVAGSQDYRRFDAYLVPLDDAQRVLGDSALDTDGPAWLTGRRERLHDRLREVRANPQERNLYGEPTLRSSCLVPPEGTRRRERFPGPQDPSTPFAALPRARRTPCSQGITRSTWRTHGLPPQLVNRSRRHAAHRGGFRRPSHVRATPPCRRPAPTGCGCASPRSDLVVTTYAMLTRPALRRGGRSAEDHRTPPAPPREAASDRRPAVRVPAYGPPGGGAAPPGRILGPRVRRPAPRIRVDGVPLGSGRRAARPPSRSGGRLAGVVTGNRETPD